MNGSIDEVMTVTEIANQVSVTDRTVLTQCKLWEEQGLARRAGRIWIVDKKIALAYIARYPRDN